MSGIVEIEITKPLPETAVAESTYKIEGSVKVLGVGALPWVYAEIKHKEWYKPEFAEEVEYERGFPMPISGDFSIDFKPEKEGDYEVKLIATPALLPLPAVGVWPTVGESDVVMKVAVGGKPPAVFRFSGVTIDGHDIPLSNHDADSGLLLNKKTTDYLEIVPSYEWVGPSKAATISVKAGHKSLGTFSPKTDAYTRTLELPESPTMPYTGKLDEAIRIPLTACGGLTDGAIEIVLKISGFDDYISRIWNVYATKAPVVTFRFSSMIIDGNEVPLSNHDADSGLLLAKTTADSLSITPTFEWQGSEKAASISIKAGYKDWSDGFTPKTGAYTATFKLPDSIDEKYSGQLTSPITVPLVACGGLDDGAIEVVLKIAGFDDYISRIWNVYATKTPGEIGFNLTTPSVSPTEIIPGTPITVTCRVTSACDLVQTITAKVKIYEGSVYATAGTLIAIKTSPAFTIAPGQSYDVIVHHTAIAGTIDRRDVEVEVYVGSQLIKESEWDDVYYVKGIELKTLEIDIPESYAGYVTTSPSPVSGTNYFVDGTRREFEKGTRVRVTAHPASGYVFDHWSDEIQGGTSTNNPEWVSDNGYMVDNKAVKAHFREGVVPGVHQLSVASEPLLAGTVLQQPDKDWYSDGEVVVLTAKPFITYRFSYWDLNGVAMTGVGNPVSWPVWADGKMTAHFYR